jgi:hypothetical protein
MAMKHFEKRDLFGIPPRETPPGVWPQTPTPSPAPRVVEPPAEPRRAPVATGEVPSGVTIIRPVRFGGDEKEQS